MPERASPVVRKGFLIVGGRGGGGGGCGSAAERSSAVVLTKNSVQRELRSAQNRATERRHVAGGVPAEELRYLDALKSMRVGSGTTPSRALF